MKHLKDKDTAVLVFAQSPELESKRLSVSRKRKATLQVLRRLNRQILATARRSGLAVIHADERMQRGESFGERLHFAMALGFAAGYRRLIVVGNDCPALRPGQLRQAAAALGSDDLVLGPTPGGGVYLLGMTRHAFQSTDLRDFSWQTGGLFRQLRGVSASVSVLAPAEDANDAVALRRILDAGVRVTGWLRAIAGLLAPSSLPCAPSFLRRPSPVRWAGNLRAPPFLR